MSSLFAKLGTSSSFKFGASTSGKAPSSITVPCVMPREASSVFLSVSYFSCKDDQIEN